MNKETIFNTSNLYEYFNAKCFFDGNDSEISYTKELSKVEKEIIIELMTMVIRHYKSHKVFQTNLEKGEIYLYRGFLSFIMLRMNLEKRSFEESVVEKAFERRKMKRNATKVDLDEMFKYIAKITYVESLPYMAKYLDVTGDKEFVISMNKTLEEVCTYCTSKNKHTESDNLSFDLTGRTSGKERLDTIRDIKAYFDQHVVGQENAKYVMAIVGENLLHAMRYGGEVKPILLSGPTGCGKTYLSTLLAKYLDIPYDIIDTTEYTEVGFNGKDVSEIAKSISKKIKYNQMKGSKKEGAVVILDEFDKRCKPSFDSGKANAAEAAQLGFLKLFEKDYICNEVNFNTVLFIMTGTFYYSEEMKKHVDPKEEKVIGFGSHAVANNKERDIDFRDICKKAGMLPELIGRTERFVMLDKLSEEILYQILVKENGTLQNKICDLKKYGINVEISENAKKNIVKKIVAEDLGARSVDNVVTNMADKILMDCIRENYSTVFVDTDKNNPNSHSLSYQYYFSWTEMFARRCTEETMEVSRKSSA